MPSPVIKLPEIRLRWIAEQSKAVGRVYGRNREDVEDLSQEAAIRAYEVWARRPDADEKFIVRCMHNRVKSELRKATVRATVANTVPLSGTFVVDFSDDATEEVHHDVCEETPHDVAVYQAELAEALGILGRIPNLQREVFLAWATVGIPEYRKQTGMKKDRAYELLQAARESISEVLRGGDPNKQPSLAL
jgi:DNA-directed RNA polymerase specialized sigma24 family protein